MTQCHDNDDTVSVTLNWWHNVGDNDDTISTTMMAQCQWHWWQCQWQLRNINWWQNVGDNDDNVNDNDVKSMQAFTI